MNPSVPDGPNRLGRAAGRGRPQLAHRHRRDRTVAVWWGRLGAAVALIAVVIGVFASPAAAHNTLVNTKPSDGAVLSSPPDGLVFEFAKDVPLETVSLDLIDAAGVRQPLKPATGTSPKHVTAQLPRAIAGALTIRWRLVGPDGHVLSERVRFTVEAGATGAPAPPDAASAPAGPTDQITEAAGPIRFGVRFAGFVAATVLGGILATSLLVSPSVAQDRRVRLAVASSTGALAATAGLGLWILASDIGGRWPSASMGDVRTALGLEAGQASAARLVLTGVVAGVLFALRERLGDRSRWAVAAAVSLPLLATWSYAGHARAARWAWLGVPLDVVHYASAAAWLGGLLLMVSVVLPDADTDQAVEAVRRFSTLASVAVTALVATGVVQGIRLVGGPVRMFTTGHGRLLIAKLIVLGVMLYVANINRKRVQRRFADPPSATLWVRHALRRAMVTESALGIAVLAVTAVLVVTTPATGIRDTAGSASPTLATRTAK